ncbi:MAG TPA: glycosyltransferase [Vicinamibacterales bacterium]|nr:glycosyltransferase [Vicinamibacterales bacterium]
MSLRVLITTWGSLGDLHPYLALGVELQRRGHAASVATLGVLESAVRQAGLGFHPIRPDVSPDDPDARELIRRVLDPRGGPAYLFERVFAPATRATYDDTVAALEAARADLLITHQVPVTGPIAAQTTEVPWVSGVLLPMSFLSAYDPATPPQAPALRRIAMLHPAVARVMNRLGRRVTESWVEPVYRLREELGLPRGDNPLFEGQHSPSLVLGLFSHVFAAKQEDYPPQTVITGFAFYDAAGERPASPDLLRFLDEGAPPVVFTLGSSAVWIAEDFYGTSIEAARALGVRAVLLAGEQTAALRRAGLPPGIVAFDYAPHSLVMPRASVIVHQGGVGTTAQALRSGRPMLIVPFGQDQPDNARRCVSLGVARTISRAAYLAPRVVSELSALLGNGEYSRRAAGVGAAVRSEHGARTACDEIERTFQRGAHGAPASRPASAKATAARRSASREGGGVGRSPT